jgi:hypothetical protein
VPAERAADCVFVLCDAGYRAAEIGVVDAPSGATSRVALDPGCRVLPPPAAAVAE